MSANAAKQVNKVALVTGASRGIGAAITRRLAAAGYAVAVNYANKAADAEALVVALRAEGYVAVAIRADVADAAEVRALFDATERALGKLDVLVNNAGILGVAPLADTSDQLFEQTLAINLRGSFNCMREAARRMNDGGRIVNFSSSSLALKLPGYAVYNASKAAVEALTPVLAKELRGRNISVNAVAPGPVATDLFLSGKTPEQIQTFEKMPPLERLGQPDDIADLVCFLVGPQAAWVNGQVLRANGGLA
ncbi:SDR family oxidoreductase [Roseateles oligotrophus]|uniref:SDR family oxidoreductase n=1 Tax=Roseateles oligotrophus TaxID=1769250 RepID=A0ABT2YEI4_9BURK|nr:SDR family oxidoreductase [Roseateles oligotrophus]MCV2368459.1 SDR family oxidoreductase [Roseateles oligotrophus]